MPIGREEADQIEREMKAAGMSDDDVVRFLTSELEREGEAPPTLGQPASEAARVTKRLGKFGLDTLIFRGLGGLGERAGATLLRQVAPRLGRYFGRLAGFGAADIASQAISNTPGEPISLPQAATSALIGKGTESIIGSIGRGAVRAGRVPKIVVKETMAQPTIGRAREMFGGVSEEAQLAEAKRVGAGVNVALRTKSPGRVEAERMIKVADQMQGPGAVNGQPIKEHILSLIDPDAVSDTALRENAALERLAEQIPDRMSNARLDKLIRELGQPVKAQIGATDVKVPVQHRKAILSNAKTYRGALLPGTTPEFAKAERYLDAVKGLRRRLFDAKGNLRDTAPNIWRKSLSKPTVQEALKKFDEQTTGRFGAFEKGRMLARKAFWNPEDGDTAEAVLLASVGWWGRASLFGGRGAGKLAILASRPAGVLAAAGTRSTLDVAEENLRENQKAAEELKSP
jgi:hypothetical protein